jgi:ribosome-binding protein aMBF1 (putative translation factor)
MKKRSLSELTSFRDWEKEFLKNKRVQKDRPYMEAEYQVMKQLIELRLRKKVSQKELAKRIDSKQPSISRLEKGLTSPTLYFLSKLATALGKRLVVEFK